MDTGRKRGESAVITLEVTVSLTTWAEEGKGWDLEKSAQEEEVEAAVDMDRRREEAKVEA